MRFNRKDHIAEKLIFPPVLDKVRCELLDDPHIFLCYNYVVLGGILTM